MHFVFQITLTDNGVPQLSSTTKVIVRVADVNDHAPEFDQPYYKVTVPGDNDPDEELFQVCLGLVYQIVMQSFPCFSLVLIVFFSIWRPCRRHLFLFAGFFLFLILLYFISLEMSRLDWLD